MFLAGEEEKKGGTVWMSSRVKIKLFGTVTSLPLRKDGGS